MIIRKLLRETRIAAAKEKHFNALKNDHRTSMIIRKMDSNCSRIKDYSQKHPKEMIIIPKSSIHKSLV